MDLIQFGIVLKAFDQMSGVFGSATSKSMGAVSRLEQRVNAFSDKLERMGTKAMGDGALLTGMMQKPVAAFMEAEDAATGLKVAMMGAGGVVDKQFGNINAKATQLGNTLPGSTADFQNMMATLVKQGISYEAILGGVGEAAAYLGVLLKKPPEQAAEFAAKLQDATGTAEKDMMSLMDTIQRAANLGVNDNNMLAFYTKMAPAMDTMRRKGADAAKEMAPFAVMFDQMGMQGEAAGNALRKTIQLGMDTKKVAKANAELASKGIKLDFTDGKGEFGGMANMMAQLDKLKGLNKVTQLSALKEVFGDDSETLQVLSKVIEKGADGYNETVDKLAKQATLQQRVNAQLGTLKNLWDAAAGTFTNALAGFGEAISPELKMLTTWLGDASAAMSSFIAEHPKLAKVAGLAVGGLGSLLLIVGGVTMALGMAAKLAGYALGPLGKLGGLFGKKGAAGKAAEAAGGLDVQRVWVTNWPGSGLDLGGGGGKTGAISKASKLGRLAGAAGKGLSVLGAGMAGYEIGTVANEGITQVLTATNGGKERTLGTWLYDLMNGGKNDKLLAPTPIKPPYPAVKIGEVKPTNLPAPPGKAGEVRQPALPAMAVKTGELKPSAAKAPVPLNPVAAAQSNAQAPASKTVSPQVTLHYNPTLTIQGDPIPGTDAKFKALLNAHRDELLRLINQAVENKARAAY